MILLCVKIMVVGMLGYRGQFLSHCLRLHIDIDVSNSIVWKRHVNQLIDRGTIESVKAEILDDGVCESVNDFQPIEQKGLFKDSNKIDPVIIKPVSPEIIMNRSGRVIKPPERLNV